MKNSKVTPPLHDAVHQAFPDDPPVFVPQDALPELTDAMREECRETEMALPFDKDKVKERIAVIEYAMKRGIALGRAASTTAGEVLQWVHDRIRRLPSPEDRTEYGRGRFDVFEDVRIELTRRAAPAPSGQAVAPSDDSDKPPMPAHDYARQWAKDTLSGKEDGTRFAWGERNLARAYLDKSVESAPQPVGYVCLRAVQLQHAKGRAASIVSKDDADDDDVPVYLAVSPPPAVSADEREAFEAWWITEWNFDEIGSRECYIAWQSWQARAALNAKGA